VDRGKNRPGSRKAVDRFEARVKIKRNYG